MAKMSKSQIIASLADGLKVSKKDAKMFLEALNMLAIKEVKKNGEFVFAGLGKLVKLHRKARVGRNPATGATIQIPAKTVVKFRIAKAVKEAVL